MVERISSASRYAQLISAMQINQSNYNKLTAQYEAKKIRTEIFKHNIELYNSYDTLQKIVTNEEYSRPPAGNNINITLPTNLAKHGVISRR